MRRVARAPALRAYRRRLRPPLASSPVAADLGAINSALARAQAEGVQFRLVVVADTAMNAMCWDHVREAGF